MKKVVIISSRNNIETFLKHEREQYYYLFLTQNFPEVEDLLRKRNFKKVDIDEGRDGIDFAKEYVDFIGRLNRDHNSLYWWATTFSYKGTFGSDLCKDIFNYYCIVSLIKRKDRSYIIISDDPILNEHIKRYCAGIGIECELLGTVKSQGPLGHFGRCLKSNVYFLFHGWLRKASSSLYLSNDIKRVISDRGYCYILKSWIDRRSFLPCNGYNDLYFGSLPEYFKKMGYKFIIVAGMLSGYKKLIKKARDVRQFVIIPQEYFAGYLDYLKVIMLNILNRPKVTRPAVFRGLEVRGLLNEGIKKDFENNEINKNLIYYYYVRGLLKKIKVHTFLFPFESQSWERMSILAIRKYSPLTKIIGYVNSALPPNFLSYFPSKEEEGILPLPDKIVTAGKEIKTILKECGAYNDKVTMSEGCALRYEYLFNKERVGWNKNGMILAALSMDIGYSLKMLRILRDTLNGKDRYKVVLRPHPFTPLEAMPGLYNLKLGNNFQISKTKGLKEDLMNSSMVVYTNTTVSIEALMSGVPVVYIDIKEPVSLDPLFRLNSLKWTVSDRDELSKVIDYIYGMDNAEYLEKYNEAMTYLKRYFYPVEESYLKEFV